MLNSALLDKEEEMKVSELTSLNTKQLREVVARANELIEGRRAEEIHEGRAKIRAIATDLGIPFSKLFGSKKANGKTPGGRALAKAKYRSKKDSALTWTGKGRMAAWLADEMNESGKDKEHFLID